MRRFPTWRIPRASLSSDAIHELVAPVSHEASTLTDLLPYDSVTLLTRAFALRGAVVVNAPIRLPTSRKKMQKPRMVWCRPRGSAGRAAVIGTVIMHGLY